MNIQKEWIRTRKHPKEQRKIYPSTTDNTKSIQHFYTIHIPSDELILKLTNKGQLLSDIVEIATRKDLPPMDTTLTNGPLDGSPQLSSDQSRGGGGGVFWSNPRKNQERTSPPTTFATQFSNNPRSERSEDVDEDDKADWATSTMTNEKGDNTKSNPKLEGGNDAESNPKEGDDAKSNPLPLIHDQPGFDGAEPILLPMYLDVNLLKGQHPRSLAEIAKVKNLPY